MRILKVLVIILAVLMLIFLSMGLFVDSYEYESSIQVKASPEKCWNVYHDTKRMGQWMMGFESLTLKAGEPMQAGSTYEIVINDHDKRMVMSETIKEVNAPTLISCELTNDVLKSEYSFSFKGDSNSTTIANHYKVAGNNVIWRSILFLSKSYMESSSREQLEELKKVIEGQQ